MIYYNAKENILGYLYVTLRTSGMYSFIKTREDVNVLRPLTDAWVEVGRFV